MNYIKSNHINSVAFNEFVPTVTKEKNSALISQILLIGTVAFIAWFLLKDYTKLNNDNKEEEC
jgi:hypothetical protein